MADRDLSGPELKLVRHKIVFLKRGLEVAFQEKEELVAESLNQSDFAGWKIAQFIQSLQRLEPPSLWKSKGYPHAYNGKRYVEGLPHQDKQYLKVFFQVLERYPRGEFRFHQRQIDVLEEIRDALAAQGNDAAPQPKPERQKPAVEPALGGEDKEVLQAIRQLGGEVATSQIAKKTGRSASDVRGSLKALIKAGLIVRVGEGFKTRYRLNKK